MGSLKHWWYSSFQSADQKYWLLTDYFQEENANILKCWDFASCIIFLLRFWIKNIQQQQKNPTKILENQENFLSCFPFSCEFQGLLGCPEDTGASWECQRVQVPEPRTLHTYTVVQEALSKQVEIQGFGLVAEKKNSWHSYLKSGVQELLGSLSQSSKLNMKTRLFSMQDSIRKTRIRFPGFWATNLRTESLGQPLSQSHPPAVSSENEHSKINAHFHPKQGNEVRNSKSWHSSAKNTHKICYQKLYHSTTKSDRLVPYSTSKRVIYSRFQPISCDRHPSNHFLRKNLLSENFWPNHNNYV